MARNKRSLSWPAKLLAVVGVLALLGPVMAAMATTASAEPLGKVFVCKYVGTPHVDERLQTGDNPISVSINSIPDYQGVGSYFADAHGRSYVLVEDNGQPEPNVSECPKPDVPPSQCPDGSNPGDLNGDGEANAEDCGYTPPPPPSQCPNGTNPGDLNGDGVANAADCGYTPPPPPPFTCPDGTQPGDHNGDGVTNGADCPIAIIVCRVGSGGDDHCHGPVYDACPGKPGNQPKGTVCHKGLNGVPDTAMGGSDDPFSNGWALVALAAMLGLLGFGSLLLSRRAGARE